MALSAPLVGLIQHIALFALAAVLTGIVLRRFDAKTRRVELLLGSILGGIALAGMAMPIEVAPGVIFDMRSVPIALAGLFAGPIGAAIAIVPAAAYRLWLGGAGTVPAMVLFALLLGISLLAHRLTVHRGVEVRLPHLLALGFSLPVAIVIAIMCMPTIQLAVQVLSSVLVPISILIPLGTVLLGLLLADEMRRLALMRDLQHQYGILTSVMDHVPAIVARYRLDNEGAPQYDYVSQRSEELLGISAEDLIAEPDRYIVNVHDDDKERFRDYFRRNAVNSENEPFEYRISIPGQPERWLRRTATPIRDGNETIWYGVSSDITAVRQAQARQQALAQIVQDIDTPVFQLDREFNITFMNAAAERIYGYDTGELIGQPGSVLRPPERVEYMAAFFGRVIADRTPDSIETDALRKDGTRIPIELHIAPLLGPDDTVEGWSSVVYDLREHKAEEDRLERLATTDELTGLPNRRAFIAAASREIERARRYHHPLSVVVADIDHFKKINDRYGHAAGDEALRVFTKAISSCLRQNVDCAARIGGEEFAVLLPETDPAGARIAAERMRVAAAAATVEHDGISFELTASFGTAAWLPGEISSERALSRADEALYEAKRRGRNMVVSAGSCEPAPQVHRAAG